MKQATLLSFLVLVSIAVVSTGAIDLDWQMVSYRYNEWHRNVDYWEYNPFIKVNWWLAYFANVMRVVLGSLSLGFFLNELRHKAMM